LRVIAKRTSGRAKCWGKIAILSETQVNQRFKAGTNGELYQTTEKTAKRPEFIRKIRGALLWNGAPLHCATNSAASLLGHLRKPAHQAAHRGSMTDIGACVRKHMGITLKKTVKKGLSE